MGRKAQGRKPTGLGKSLVKQQVEKRRAVRHNQQFAGVHVMDVEADGSKPGGALASVVDRSELDEFLCNALLKEQQFAAERSSMVVLGTTAVVKEAETAESKQRRAQRQKEEEEFGVSEEITSDVIETLKIPRRPAWNKQMTGDELDRLEKDAFLEWRRNLANLEEKTISRHITPFEKNLEIWRQLWRVLERSDVICQIIDARNPLLYRSIDLEAYIKEVSPHKRALLIINKADFLSVQARAMWAAYFHAHRIAFVFFSAQSEQDVLDAETDAVRKAAKEAAAKRKAYRQSGRLRTGSDDDDDDKALAQIADNENDDDDDGEGDDDAGADPDGEYDTDEKADPRTKPSAAARRHLPVASSAADENVFAKLNADGDDDDDDAVDDDNGAAKPNTKPTAKADDSKATAIDAKNTKSEKSNSSAPVAPAAAASTAPAAAAVAVVAAAPSATATIATASPAPAVADQKSSPAPAAAPAAAAATTNSATSSAASVGVTAAGITPVTSHGDAPLSAGELFALTHVYNRHELIQYCIEIAKTVKAATAAAADHKSVPISSSASEMGDRLFIGMVGYPNVGKSSTINVLCGKKRVAVSATPGKTKHFQTINLTDEVTLCDCPGLVFPTFMASRANLVINGILPIDQMHDYMAPIQQICSRIGQRQWLEAYTLTFPNWKAVTSDDLLVAHAKMRGWTKDHGGWDGSRSARLILKDYVAGKLLYCSPPPHLNVDQRHIFHTSYNRVHIASRKGKSPDAADPDDAPPTAAAAAAAPAAASAGAAAASAAPQSQLVISAGTGRGAGRGSGGSGPNGVNLNVAPIIGESERPLLEEMYHISKPLTKTAFRKAKKDKSQLAIIQQNSPHALAANGKKHHKKHVKTGHKQTIALGDVEAHTMGKNPISNFRRFNMLDLSSAPAVAPVGPIPQPTPAPANATAGAGAGRGKRAKGVSH